MRAIPEGYTYVRCDQYTPEEFIRMYTNDKGEISEYCLEYMRDNPKDIYNTDDQIAIRMNARERDVGSIIAFTGKNTTKRYHYDQA